MKATLKLLSLFFFVVTTRSAAVVSSLDQLNAAIDANHIIIKNLNVPANVTLSLDKLKPGTLVEFEGNTTFGFAKWQGPLIRIAGKGVRINGKNGAWINCEGERWWDGTGGNDGCKKPKFISLKLENSTVSNLNVKNLPVHGFSVSGCKNLNITNILIDTKEGHAKGGHNTDGFDVSNSEAVSISNSVIWNQDDCLAINSGIDIKFIDNKCYGGHGISIGSVGGRKNNIVRGVLVRNCEVADSDNGIRIKTTKGASGSVKDITFDNIVLKNIAKRGISIQGNYMNSRPDGEPTGGVPIEYLTVNNVRGNVLPGGANIYIWVKNASNWRWESDIVGGKKLMNCTGIPPGVDVQCGK